MSQFFEDEEDRTFIQRHRGLLLIGIILVLGIGIFFAFRLLSGSSHSSSRQDDITTIRLPPPPPPPTRQQPTPPPQQQPTPEQQDDHKMEEQQPVQDEKKEEAPKEKPPNASAPLGTGITGPGGGPDLGLGAGLGGGGGGGYGSGGGGGSKYGWYAGGVQRRIQQAISSNPRTRTATMNVIIRIWPDSTGRIVKVRVSGDSSDPSLNAALQDQVLNGLQMDEPPPPDMPLPIVMRVTAQRPH